MAEERDWGLPIIKLAIVVEGRTEVNFVKEVLLTYLRRFGIDPVIPIPINPRGRVGAGGGNVSVNRLVKHMVRLRRTYGAVTSLVDFYGFRTRESDQSKRCRSILLRKSKRKFQMPGRRSPMFKGMSSKGFCFPTRTLPGG